ncbi:Beta-ketoacyl synthase [Sarocladium implicatum]|nr:Beta-ketoacyl synthase [Sarocladium implicatum]
MAERRGEPAQVQAEAQNVVQKRQGMLPHEFVEIMVPPLKVGGWSGAFGVFTGVAAGIGQDVSLAQAGFMNGMHWFTLGTTYWFTRSTILRMRGPQSSHTPTEKTVASTLAGATAGALTGLLRGPNRIMPSALMWAATMTGGQIGVNYWSSQAPKQAGEDDSWLRSKWSPLKKLTDKEYIEMMEEKRLKLDVEIALIDDRIADLRLAQAKSDEEQSQASKT